MKIVNLTAHNVDICDEYGKVIKTYKPSGIVVRNAWFPEQVDIIDDVDGLFLFFDILGSRKLHFVL